MMRQLFFVLLIILMGTDVKLASASLEEGDVILGSESQRQAHPAPPSTTSSQISSPALELFNNDYVSNVRDLLNARWFFRKVANCNEAAGNTCLYCSAGAPAVAAAINPFSLLASHVITCFGLSALGVHVTLIGIAKCSAREETEREAQLSDLAKRVGFQVVSLQPTITDDSNDQAQIGGISPQNMIR
ncbi:MAG: hypothetical protein ACK4V2_07475 [Pseudomonadota bacterium]|jgi:hypothetical protein|nr:hypothetical protein [Alphaproteobacteria bacterium]